MTTNQLIEKHINQINKLAWSFAKTTGQDFDDLKSVGTLAMIKAIKSFDDQKGTQLSTLVHISATNAMASYCKKQTKTPVVDEPMEVKSKYVCQTRRHEFLDTLASLGNEAKQICKIIFASPGEVLNIAVDESSFRILFEAPGEVLDAIQNESPCKARIMIKQYMADLGYTKDEIKLGIREIQESFVL